MAALLTTAGIAHLAELDATWPTPVTTESMDALIFGAGNDVPALGDTQASLTSGLGRLIRVEAGYPVLGDFDSRNTGRAVDRYTWKFRVAAGSPFVASNVALTNWNGGVLSGTEPVGVHEKVVVSQRFDEDLNIWVNAKTGAVPTIVTAVEPHVIDQGRRVHTWTARVRALRSLPAGALQYSHRVRVAPPRGQSVWTAALLEGCKGKLLQCGEVVAATLSERSWEAASRTWLSRKFSLSVADVVTPSPVTGDARWPDGTYNFAHSWTPQRAATREVTWELLYELRLVDGSFRRVEVEVRPV